MKSEPMALNSVSCLKLPLLFAGLCGIALAGLATGQQQENPRTCRILVLSGPGSVPEKLHLFDGLVSREVEMPRMNLSPVYEIAPGSITIRMLSEPLLDPKALPAEAPSIVVPANLRDIYLLVTADRSNNVAPVKLAVVNANHERLGRGEILWYNLSDKAVAGKIGSRTLNLKPGASTVLGEPASGHEEYPVELYFRVQGDDFTHPLCETQWRHDPRSRSLAFIITEGKRKVPRVFTYADYREPKKEQVEELP